MARYVPSQNLVTAAETRQGARYRPSNQLLMEPSEAANPALHASSNFRPFLDEYQGPNRWGDMGLSAKVDASGNRKLGTPPQRLRGVPPQALPSAQPMPLTVAMDPASTPIMERADVSGLGAFWGGFKRAVEAPLHLVARVAAPPLHATQRFASPVLNFRQAALERVGLQHPSNSGGGQAQPAQAAASGTPVRKNPTPPIWDDGTGWGTMPIKLGPPAARPLSTPIERANVAGLGAISATNPFVLGALGLGAVGILAYVLLRKKGR